MMTLAESQPEYVTLGELKQQALAGWHQTYAVSGREVTANADIKWMPNTDRCPVVQIVSISGEVIRQSAQGKPVTIEPFTPHAELGAYFTWNQNPLALPSQEYSGDLLPKQNLTFYDGEAPPKSPRG